ncbi:hypothetical protein HanPSC8_Chr03g0120521 [Helianthus annuus]|nr:hypothetical protein HanIR_Chr03g0135181 [Helianthus annuus]KAJ0944771.1 hypothetical protein HanPSC8_Chr03g0120521 [Helianthus annuus]
MLAVGYVDRDIILRNIPTAVSANNQKGNKVSNNVVKLKLSSGDRRLPVIVLHWSNSPLSGSAGQLFVYGGDFGGGGGWMGGDDVVATVVGWWVWRKQVVEGACGCGGSVDGGRRLWFQSWWKEVVVSGCGGRRLMDVVG